MKILLTLFGSFICYLLSAQSIDTSRYVINGGIGYQYKSWKVDSALIIPRGGDTLSKIPGLEKVIGSKLGFVGTDRVWHVVDVESINSSIISKLDFAKQSVVTSVAGLRTLTNIQSDVPYVTYDNGGGTWYYDATDNSSVDNNGTIILNGTKRLKKIFKIVTPDDFGAPHDGIHSDVAAFKAAIAAADVVELKASSIPYLLDSQILISKKTFIKGQGAASAINTTINDGSAVFYSNVNYCKLENLWITGVTRQNFVGVRWRSNRSSIDHIHIEKAATAFWFDSVFIVRTYDMFATNCDTGLVATIPANIDFQFSFENCKKGFAIIAPGNVSFTNCMVEGGVGIEPNPVASSIDGGYGVWGQLYFEQDVMPSPFITIGTKSAIKNVDLQVTISDACINSVSPIVLDNVEQVKISGRVGSALSSRKIIKTSINTKGFTSSIVKWDETTLTDSSGRMGITYNYFPNSHFDAWLNGWNDVLVTGNVVFSKETSLVRKTGGTAMRIQTTGSGLTGLGSVTFRLKTPQVERLRGKTVSLYAWVYVPNIAEFPDQPYTSNATNIPNIYLGLQSNNGSSNGTGLTYSASKRFIKGDWNLLKCTYTVQTDAILLDALVNISGTTYTTTGNEYIVVGDIFLLDNDDDNIVINGKFVNSDVSSNMHIGGRYIGYASATPTSTTMTYNVGDYIYNTNTADNQNIGWECITPGVYPTAVWKAFGFKGTYSTFGTRDVGGTEGTIATFTNSNASGGSSVLITRKITSRGAQVSYNNEWYAGILRDGGAVTTKYAISSNPDINVSGAEFVINNGSIGINNRNPNTSAALDVTSTSKGVLLPRMNRTQAAAITATNGMFMYDNVSNKFLYSDGTIVRTINDSASSSISTTVSGLRSMSNPQTNVLYQTTDNGGGQWYYDPTDNTSTDNVGTVIVSGTKRFKRNFSGPVDVRWFGVLPDGIDHATELQAMANTGVQSVVFPTVPGAVGYLINSTVTFSGTVDLFGSRFGTPIMSDINDHRDLFVFNGKNSLNSLYITGHNGKKDFVAIHAKSPRFSMDNVRVEFVGMGVFFDNTWVGSIDRSFISTCDTGYRAIQLNGADIKLDVENCKKGFQIENCTNLGFKDCIVEGGDAFSPVPSTIDGGKIIHGALYFEGGYDFPSAHLVMGGTTLVSGIDLLISAVGAYTGLYPVVMDRVSAWKLTAIISVGESSKRVIKTTANTKAPISMNIIYGGYNSATFTDSSGQMGRRLNYFPNSDFKSWFNHWTTVALSNTVYSKETTIVRKPGQTAVRLSPATTGTPSAGYMAFKLQTPYVEEMRNKKLTMFAWVYVPNIAEYPDQKFPTTGGPYPNVFVALNSYNGATVSGTTVQSTRFIKGDWNLMVSTVTVQSDATEVNAFIQYLGSGSYAPTGNEYVVVSNVYIIDDDDPSVVINGQFTDAPSAQIVSGGRLLTHWNRLPFDAAQLYNKGDVIRNDNVNATDSSYSGWICTTAGTGVTAVWSKFSPIVIGNGSISNSTATQSSANATIDGIFKTVGGSFEAWETNTTTRRRHVIRIDSANNVTSFDNLYGGSIYGMSWRIASVEKMGMSATGNISFANTGGTNHVLKQLSAGGVITSGLLDSSYFSTSYHSAAYEDGKYFPLTGGTLSGITNTGFVGFHPQTTAMTAPTDGFKIFDSSGIVFLRSDGYRRTLSFSGLSANVKYNFPVGTTGDTITTNIAPQTLTNKTINIPSNIITGVLPIVNGGTGSSTAAFTAGTNVTITGTFPNYTISAAGGTGNMGIGNAITGASVGSILYSGTNGTLQQPSNTRGLYYDSTNNTLIHKGDATHYVTYLVDVNGNTNITSTGGTTFSMSPAVVINNSLSVGTAGSGNLHVSNTLSTTTVSQAQFEGSTTIGYRSLERSSVNPVLAVVGESYVSHIIGDVNVTEATSGTHPLLSSFAIKAPTFTNGSASTTLAATSYIEGEPTGITATNGNWSSYVKAGKSFFGGTVQGVPATSSSQFVTRQQVTDTLVNYKQKSDSTTNSTSYATIGQVQKRIDSLGAKVSYGTYTPSLIYTTNISLATADVVNFTKIGNITHLTITGNINPTTASGATELTFTLPVACTNSLGVNIGFGNIGLNGGGSYTGAEIILMSSTTAKIRFITTTTGSSSYQISTDYNF